MQWINPYSGKQRSEPCYDKARRTVAVRFTGDGVSEVQYSEIIVQRIKSLCRQRGISYNKLASMSGLNQSSFDNIIRGLTKDPRIKTLHHIAIAFNMTLAEFLDFPELNEVSFEEIDDGANQNAESLA